MNTVLEGGLDKCKPVPQEDVMNEIAQAQPGGGSSSGRRKRRSPEQLTNRILHAATEEFKRLGYAGATTAAIARRADVTEAQLFRYFGSKANLFREAIFEPLDEQLLRFTNTHVEDGDRSLFEENAALYIDELRKFIAENVDMITSLVAAEMYEKQAAHGVGAIGSLGRYFDRGASVMRERGDQPKVDPRLMVRVSFVAVLACVMFRDWIFPRAWRARQRSTTRSAHSSSRVSAPTTRGVEGARQ